MLCPGEIICDNFAGGGGASLGIEMALGRGVDVAVNHDAEAVAMHAANHPGARHFCQSIMSIDPREAARGRPVGLAWFSPDCKHFSKAKGAKPVEKRIRDLAWIVVHWAEYVRPRVICLENVEEFRDWGPLADDGRPCPVQKGLTFQRWVKELRKRGYKVEWRELRACDYGSPTIRKRLFLIARCDGQPIVWPQPTHGPKGGGGLLPYRTAAECIDWSRPCHSIFLTREEVRERKLRINRPLAKATMRRIARGVKRYVLDAAEPFLVRTVTTAQRGEQAFVTPFLARTDMHKSNAGCCYPADEALRTVTSGGGHAVVSPFVAGVGGRMGQSPERPAGRPFQTLTAKADSALVAPLLVPRYGEREGQAPRCQSIEAPMPTVVPSGNGANLVAAFMAQHNAGVVGHGMEEPVSTLTQRGTQQQMVAVNLSHQYGSATAGGQGDPRKPLKTITTGGHHALVAAFLAKYYGTGGQDQDAREPLHTVPGKGRFSAVTIQIDGRTYAIVDIGMRMLTPRELFRAQGFPSSYVIDPLHDGKPLTKTAQIRMVGNSVCPQVASAIVAANVGCAVMPDASAMGAAD